MRALLALILTTTMVAAQPSPFHLPALDRLLPARAERTYKALTPRVDAEVAMATVRMMSAHWRLAGNPGFEQSQQFIFNRLTAAGLSPRYESFENNGMGWEHHRGTLRLDGPAGEILLSRETHRVALAINSFSTAAGGASFRLIDVGGGIAGAHDEQDFKGAVVLTDGALGVVWQQAVRDRGAAGVISTSVASFTRPEETPDVLQWGGIPFDESRQSFGFKVSPGVARRLRDALAKAKGRVMVHVDIESTFHRRPNRTLVLEMPGSTRAHERVVMAAHVQEPGANDNASGCGTLLATALAIHNAIRAGALPPPARTLTFLWLDEIRGSQQWVKADGERLKNVIAMLSLDMTGEDTARTGGTFLIEKSPDPSAVWDRPSDPHSEWGRGKVDPKTVRGSFLNDLHLAVSLRRARDTKWVVRTNPYEGGSDHTVFTEAGVPALLNWHFTDRYYHTNLDTLDKTSPAEMQHVGIAVATTAMFLGAADAGDVPAMTALIEAAREARLETEKRNNATPEIVAAWQKWYDEALQSLSRFQN